MKKNSGFALIELLCVMVIGIIILAEAISFYLYQEKIYRKFNQKSQEIENSLLAKNVLKYFVRSVSPANITLYGFKNRRWSRRLHNLVTKQALKNSNIIKIKKRSNAFYFYIKTTERKINSSQQINSLYQMDSNGHQEELVDRIDRMQVLAYRYQSHQLKLVMPDEIDNYKTLVGLKINLICSNHQYFSFIIPFKK